MIRYDDLLSGRVKDLKPSGIRKFFDVANEMDGVISLGVGEPDFKTPWSIREAGIYSLEKGRTWYTANAGLPELRREIAAYLDRRFHLQYEPKTEMMVTVGGSEGIDACIRALCDEGDEVLIPEPCFVSYDPCTRLCGAVPVPVRLKAENQFKLTPADLEGKITPRTKALILPFPNNPTGAVMRREDLEPLADFLRDKNIIVLSDEIYSELTYDGTHVSIAELPGMKERTVVINGFSKSYAMTGWRLGYACGPREIIGQMYKIHQFAIMCAPTTSQFAAIEAVKNCDGEIAAMREEYDMRRRLITAGFNELGLETFTPEGAFYIFPCIKSTGLTSDEFCEKLLYSQRVAVVPGTAFGESGEGYVRVSYSYSVDHIKTALERVAQFLESL